MATDEIPPVEIVPAFDVSSFYSGGFYTRNPFTLGAGSLTYTGYPVTFSVGRVLRAEAGQYTVEGQPVVLARSFTIAAQSGNYTVTGYPASLNKVRFFYIDSEVIYVPQEANLIVVPPAVVSADVTIAVPAEVQQVMLAFEDREIVLPADDPIEELAEDRESAAEARLRTS